MFLLDVNKLVNLIEFKYYFTYVIYYFDNFLLNSSNETPFVSGILK